MAEYDEEESEKLLRNARLLLWIALAAAIVSVPALFFSKAGLFMVCWFAAFLGGLGGVRDSSRGSRGNPVLMYASLVLVFVPLLNIAPIGYYLWRASQALAGGLEPPEPVVAPAPRRAALCQARKPHEGGSRRIRCHGSAASGAKARARLLTAIASLKLGTDLQGADGTLLQVSIPNAPADLDRGSLPVLRATQGVFGICYLVDQGATYEYASAGELQASGLTLDALHMVGVKNLARLVNGKPGLEMLPQPDGVIGLAMGGQFEASLVLVDALWDEALRKHYKTAPVVTIAARDILAFCDEGSEAGIAGLRAIAERIRTGGDRFITDQLYVRRDGRWQAFNPGKRADLAPLEFGH